MKRISKLICSIMTAVILAFNTAVLPALHVQAAQYAALGLYEILKGLLFTAGINTAGLSNITDLQKSDAAYDSLVTAVFKDNPVLAKYLTQMDELDQDASFRAEFEEAKEGTEFDYGEFKILKDAAGINRVYASRKLVQEAANAINEWAESEENMTLVNYDSPFHGLGTVSYYSNVVNRGSDYRIISDLYDESILKLIHEMGYDESNCFLYSAMVSIVPSYNGFITELEKIETVKRIFFIVPSDVTYVSHIRKDYYDSSDSLTEGSFFYTDALVSIWSWLYTNDMSEVAEWISGRRAPIDCVLYTNDGDVYSAQLSDSSSVAGIEYCCYRFEGLEVYNYDFGILNNSYLLSLIDVWNSPNRITMLDCPVESFYISSSESGSRYANTDDYVSMEFDATTAETLSGYSSLADYISYATSLSKQLSDIKDAIEDSTQQNAAQAKEIVSSIHAQTDTLSAGISDVITSVKVQTDAISDVLEATKLQTDAIGDVITGIDETIAAIQDLSITLPSDLTLTIPEEMMNITVQVPDISTEVINQIEVTQDYAALQDVITTSVSGVMADVFVPSADVVDTTLHNFHDKFGFVDDMKTNIDNMQTVIFGIKPSPILKIPIMQPNSKYDYGFGDYIIIDVSWYAAYKKYGDTLILSFLWLMFLWRMFIRLPGIINGTSADIVSMSNAIERYERSHGGKHE